jgi:hypothetical protein
MRTCVVHLIVLAGLTLPGVVATSAAQDDVRGRLVGATNALMGRGATPPNLEDFERSIRDLMDLAAAITPDNQYKAEIQSRLAVARDRVRDYSLFDAKARQYVSFAYRMMTNGRRYETPAELSQFVTPAELQEKTLRHIDSLVTQSLRSVDAGHRQDAARILLEIVLLTMTPSPG